MQSESSDSNLTPSSGSDDELDTTEIAQSGVKLIQTGSKRCGQAPGPKAKTKRVRKEQRFVKSWLQNDELKSWLQAKSGRDARQA